MTGHCEQTHLNPTPDKASTRRLPVVARAEGQVLPLR